MAQGCGTPGISCSTRCLRLFHPFATFVSSMSNSRLSNCNWTSPPKSLVRTACTRLPFVRAAQAPRAQEVHSRDTLNQLTMETDSVGPSRFLAVHGRRSLVQGYATRGIEIWGYPLQIVSGYEVGFRKRGTTSELKGTGLLRKITYEPEAIVR